MKFAKFLRKTILKNISTTASNVIEKETPTQLFSCEFCELFKKTYFREHLRMAGSKTPVRGVLFNKVASLTAWRPLTALERDSSRVIFL